MSFQSCFVVIIVVVVVVVFSGIESQDSKEILLLSFFWGQQSALHNHKTKTHTHTTANMMPRLEFIPAPGTAPGKAAKAVGK